VAFLLGDARGDRTRGQRGRSREFSPHAASLRSAVAQASATALRFDELKQSRPTAIQAGSSTSREPARRRFSGHEKHAAAIH
jgi:hypothetical protein